MVDDNMNSPVTPIVVMSMHIGRLLKKALCTSVLLSGKKKTPMAR
jgi:hypothetical protein